MTTIPHPPNTVTPDGRVLQKVTTADGRVVYGDRYDAKKWVRLQHFGGSPSLKYTLDKLIDYADVELTCFPSRRRLAEDTEQSMRNVQRNLAKLERLGLVTREARYRPNDQGQTSNLFRLHLEVVVNLSPDEGEGGGEGPTGPVTLTGGGGHGVQGGEDASVAGGETGCPGGETAQPPPGDTGVSPRTTNELPGNNYLPALRAAGAAAPTPPIDVQTSTTINKRAQEITKAYTDRVPLSRFPAVMGIVKKGIAAGHTDIAISEALIRLADEGRPVTIDTLRVELEGLPARGHYRKDTTDDRVRGFLEIGARLSNGDSGDVGAFRALGGSV